MERGEAKPYWRKGIFCILLLRKESDKREEYKDVVIGIDTGSKRYPFSIGFSWKEYGKRYYAAYGINMLYMAKINNIVFADYTLSLLALAIADTLENAESYLYYYGMEAAESNIFFQKINNNKNKFSLSKREIDMVYDIIYQELVG